MVMDEHRKTSPFASPMGGGGAGGSGGGAQDFGGSKSPGNFPAEQPIVFGSGGAASNNSNSNSAGVGAAKRGRERPRSASPISRPPIPPNQFAGHQQDAAGKGFGKSPEQQREEEAAKARRLLRFGAEFGARPKAAARSASTNGDDEASVAMDPATGAALEQGSRNVTAGMARFRDNSAQSGRSEAAGGEAVMVDMDTPDNMTSEPILGVCPDMCPESERSERERKGDLDRFERVGGNRNETSVELAVKKYTRTAEKDAVLIRPLPVLKKTMGHLLSLLERDHEDDLMPVHSFLWDRMRAVRMDLRMQHIFTDDAIAMHEQMIRFHILAMHELCEFSEGEGISEVFNAHLNIEQMNKASVDLFQMYDDHLKGGISVPSEAEFRGYYALLKLDKHPGYNVEPAELSLDLAKMTREIRNSEEVRFARDVARACRAGNFVAFFRLAREATYLQACLMHAHFSKLRTLALASLHSCLQKNQGVPLSKAIDWLGMEGDDIESLIKYYGFTIKYYEEAYMVKEGPFLNKNQDFPTCRAQLVELKRSLTIVMDVHAEKQSDTMARTPLESKRSSLERKSMLRMGSMERKGPPSSELPSGEASLESHVQTKEEEMPDYVEEPIDEEEEEEVEEGEVEEGEVEEIEDKPVAPVAEVVIARADEEGKQGKKRRMDEPQFDAEEVEKRRLRHEADAMARRAASQALAEEMKRIEEQRIRAGHDAEAYLGRQGTWFRKWRRRAVAKALERHRKQLETEAALETLSVGLPLWKMRVGGASVSSAQRTEYTKDLVESQGLKLQQMWEPLDIPKLVGSILQRVNPAAQSLAWRVFLSTPGSPSGQWVRAKVGSQRKSGAGRDFNDQTRSNISIVLRGNSTTADFQCSAKDLSPPLAGLHSNVLRGADGLLFVVNEDELALTERARLHSLVQTLPEGANVPLLVLSTRSRLAETREGDASVQKELTQQLKLGDLRASRISNFRVVSIAESSTSSTGSNVYLSDKALKEGIAWLAAQCPVQPQLRSLRVADLVREHLDTGLQQLLRLPFADVNPERCISLFNEGIRQSAAEIEGVASSVASSVPSSSSSSSTIDQTSYRGAGHRSSQETLEALFTNLNSFCLPPFPPFKPEHDMGNITMQKLGFEDVLLQFLNKVEGNSSHNQVAKWEVTRLVQRGCTVEWSESGLRLVPKWAQIFQAIFAGRLLLLSIKPWPPVYIARMKKTLLDTDGTGADTTRTRAGSDFSGEARLSLDDMIGGEFQRHVPVESETVSPSEENVVDVLSSSPSHSHFESGADLRFDREPAVNSRLHWTEATDELILPEPMGALERYKAYRLPQDSPFEWLAQRDEVNPAKRLRLACTEPENSLDKMLAEVRRLGSTAENVYKRTFGSLGCLLHGH